MLLHRNPHLSCRRRMQMKMTRSRWSLRWKSCSLFSVVTTWVRGGCGTVCSRSSDRRPTIKPYQRRWVLVSDWCCSAMFCVLDLRPGLMSFISSLSLSKWYFSPCLSFPLCLKFHLVPFLSLVLIFPILSPTTSLCSSRPPFLISSRRPSIRDAHKRTIWGRFQHNCVAIIENSDLIRSESPGPWT